MSKQAGGRPAKSGARRELKTFRLVPDAIARLERFAGERGGSTSDILNEMLLAATRLIDPGEGVRGRHLEVLPSTGPLRPVESLEDPAVVSRFRVLDGGGRIVDDRATRVAHELERLRDALGGLLGELEDLMVEQADALEAPRKSAKDEYAGGFRAGMLEALETAYALLQAELLISEGFGRKL